MESSDNYCLRWNDFEANISAAFRDLRNDDDFCDVTLACNADKLSSNIPQPNECMVSKDQNHHYIRAHKVRVVIL